MLLLDDGRTKPTPRDGKKPLPEPSEYMCLMRATLRNKKISTVVSWMNRGIIHMLLLSLHFLHIVKNKIILTTMRT